MKSGKPAKIIKAAGIFLALFFILMALLSFSNPYMVIHPPRVPIVLTPSDYGMGYETVNFESLDGLPLKGWFIPDNRSRSLVIVCHGHGSNKEDVLFAAKFLHEDGYDVFLFDFRAHGESGGGFATLGWLETKDLRGAIEYVSDPVNGISPGSVGILGFSMGGATAITTAGMLPSSEIQAVVTDSAYPSRRKLISRGLLFPQLSRFTLLFLQAHGLDLEQNLPIEHVSGISPTPLLMIQGDQDHLVETEDSRSLYRAAGPPKDLWIVPDTPHVGAYLTHRREYERRVLEFFGKYLK